MLPLEDFYNDILGKAQRGLQISDLPLSQETGIPLADYERVRSGEFDEAIVRKVAPLLQLDADSLVALGKKEWHPGVEDFPEGLARTNTQFGDDMTVNAYVAWDPATKDAVVFDTGADAAPMLEIIKKNDLKVKYILLTHTHGDHVAELPVIAKATNATIHVHKNEPTKHAEAFDWGKTFEAGSLKIETRRTSGHAVGGTTYFIAGLKVPVAIVGDAIFAGSMGGGMISYADALKTNRENIFSLPDETILCPGHGPLTTVALEKKHNPFFPEF